MNIERNQLGSIRAVRAFLKRGHFHYALDPVRSTSARRSLDWVDWIAIPAVTPALDPEVFSEAVESLGLGLEFEARTSHDAFRWLSTIKEPVRLGLTVSGSSLRHPEFARRLIGQIERFELNPARLCFKLAVHAALSDLGGATRFVKAVRQAGSLVTLCNGIPGNPVLGLYGPLGYVNHLRIDRQWIETAPQSSSHQQTLESIIDYARRLRLAVIADGVDRQDQLDLVSSMGIDYYAGALHGRPALVAESRGEQKPLVRIANR